MAFLREKGFKGNYLILTYSSAAPIYTVYEKIIYAPTDVLAPNGIVLTKIDASFHSAGYGDF